MAIIILSRGQPGITIKKANQLKRYSKLWSTLMLTHYDCTNILSERNFLSAQSVNYNFIYYKLFNFKVILLE